MPLDWTALAYSRRETLGAVGIEAAPTALATTSEAVTDNGITVDPTVTIVDGIIQGTLQASNTSGLPMAYKFVESTSGGKLAFGTVPVSPTETDPQSYTVLPYATWLDSGGGKGTEEFRVRVGEVTEFDTVVVNIPLVGMLAGPVIGMLQSAPLVGDLLTPLIGASVLVAFDVPVAELAPGATPVAFTYKVTSFDGTLISTNFFPAAGLAAGDTAPTVLNQPGLGSPGAINPYAGAGTEPYTIGIAPLRQSDYNVVTWDPRGCFDSGGVLQLDNPFFEGRDASAIISWVAGETPAALNGPDDPKVGMVGGSYGGAIQLTTASTDPRVDAIVPGATWNSLNQALYPTDIFKTAWANALLLYLLRANADINDQVYSGVISGNLVGLISETAQAVLASSGPTVLLNQMKAPTLLMQGSIDALSHFRSRSPTPRPLLTIPPTPW